MLFTIGLVYNNNDKVVGVRLLDTSNYKTMDITYNSAVSALESKKAKIENIKLEGKRLVPIDKQETLEEYPCISSINKSNVIRNKDVLIVVGYNKENNSITISNYDGLIVTLSIKEVHNWSIIRNKGELKEVIMKQEDTTDFSVSPQMGLLANRLTKKVINKIRNGLYTESIQATNVFSLYFRATGNKCILSITFNNERKSIEEIVEIRDIKEIHNKIEYGIKKLLCRL